MSVVIPTRNRVRSVIRLARAIDSQRFARGRLELVVVADGGGDAVGDALARADLTVATRVVHLPEATRSHRGAGAVRNAGIDASTHDIVLFLDDDVQPTDEHLITRHAAAHERLGRPGAVVGLCVPDEVDPSGYLRQTHRSWWMDQLRRLHHPPLTFTDTSTGNLSVARSVLDDVGGFRDLPRREDWDLGHRIRLSGAPLVCAPDAVVEHRVAPTVAGVLDDTEDDGRGDAAMVDAHPELFGALALTEWSSMSGRNRRVLRTAASTPGVRRGVLATGRLLPLLERAGLREQHRRLLRRLTVLRYWQGVFSEISTERWHEVLRAGQGMAQGTGGGTVDLLDGTIERPGPGDPQQLVVTAGGHRLGVLSMAAMRTPWDPEAAVELLVEAFADHPDLLRAQLFSMAGPALDRR